MSLIQRVSFASYADLTFAVIKNAFEVSIGKNKNVFCAPTPEEKASWLKDLKSLKKEFQKAQISALGKKQE
jgi:hypothetical protein